MRRRFLRFRLPPAWTPAGFVTKNINDSTSTAFDRMRLPVLGGFEPEIGTNKVLEQRRLRPAKQCRFHIGRVEAPPPMQRERSREELRLRLLIQSATKRPRTRSADQHLLLKRPAAQGAADTFATKSRGDFDHNLDYDDAVVLD